MSFCISSIFRFFSCWVNFRPLDKIETLSFHYNFSDKLKRIVVSDSVMVCLVIVESLSLSLNSKISFLNRCNGLKLVLEEEHIASKVCASFVRHLVCFLFRDRLFLSFNCSILILPTGTTCFLLRRGLVLKLSPQI